MKENESRVQVQVPYLRLVRVQKLPAKKRARHHTHPSSRTNNTVSTSSFLNICQIAIVQFGGKFAVLVGAVRYILPEVGRGSHFLSSAVWERMGSASTSFGEGSCTQGLLFQFTCIWYGALRMYISYGIYEFHDRQKSTSYVSFSSVFTNLRKVCWSPCK